MADSKSDSIINEHFATKGVESPQGKALDLSLNLVLDNALWQYACRIYSQLGVEAELLALQDNHGADINLILQALWLASEGIEWTPDCIPNDYGHWVEEQILPVRQMRRRMKTDWPAQEEFRQQVKKLELKAEQYALAMLFSRGLSVRGRSMSANISEIISSNIILLAKHFNISKVDFEQLVKVL